MYIGPNIAGSHNMLLGDSAARPLTDRADMLTTRGVQFNRPISAAQAIMDGLIEAFPDHAAGPAVRHGYAAWVEKTSAFRKAANSGAAPEGASPSLANGGQIGVTGEEIAAQGAAAAATDEVSASNATIGPAGDYLIRGLLHSLAGR